jgi:hypothetical protein
MNAPMIRLDLLNPRLRVVEGGSVGGVATKKSKEKTPETTARGPSSVAGPIQRHPFACSVVVPKPETTDGANARALARWLNAAADVLEWNNSAFLEVYGDDAGRIADVTRDKVRRLWAIHTGMGAGSAKDRDPTVRERVVDVCRYAVNQCDKTSLDAPVSAFLGVARSVVGMLTKDLSEDELARLNGNLEALATALRAMHRGKRKRQGEPTTEQALGSLFEALEMPVNAAAFKRTKARRKQRKGVP